MASGIEVLSRPLEVLHHNLGQTVLSLSNHILGRINSAKSWNRRKHWVPVVAGQRRQVQPRCQEGRLLRLRFLHEGHRSQDRKHPFFQRSFELFFSPILVGKKARHFFSLRQRLLGYVGTWWGHARISWVEKIFPPGCPSVKIFDFCLANYPRREISMTFSLPWQEICTFRR